MWWAQLCVDVIGYFVVVEQKAVSEEGATFLGLPWETYKKRSGIRNEDLWDTNVVSLRWMRNECNKSLIFS